MLYKQQTYSGILCLYGISIFLKHLLSFRAATVSYLAAFRSMTQAGLRVGSGQHP